ncbi:hypothetical protein ABZY58_10985 [Micromonospora tulbaghiae]|uniref:hypothetical protein n=1 Tax=Micromonospora tulbaghiae TaxID=479978 RepID=UPI0033A9F811
MHQLRARRQRTGHAAYAAIAGGLGALALLVWGTILRDAAEAPPHPPTRGYLAFLAAAIVLGVSASAATASWMSTRVNQRLHAEADQLRDYDDERLVRDVARQIIKTAGEKQFAQCVANEVTRQLNERERAAKQQRWETLLCDTGTTGPIPAPPQQPRGNDQVVPFTRRPGNARNSG